MFESQNRFSLKRSEPLLRRMTNNSLVNGEQPAETPTCEVDE